MEGRGISITSTALRFPVPRLCHPTCSARPAADFSEDTYRVLTAVDCAVMLIDAAKGLEPQTRSSSRCASTAASRSSR